MSEQELVLRSKLIQLRKHHLHVPVAPQMMELEAGSTFALGSNCDLELHGYDEVFAFILKAKNQMVATLNYTDTDVEVALRAVETSDPNAAGFSQSQHNCEDFDNFDEEPIDFQWEPSEKLAPRDGLSPYAEIAPYLRDLHKAAENSSPENRKYAIAQIELLTKELLGRRKAEIQDCAPKGKVVSGKLRVRNPKSKHKKQDYFAGGCS